jgi:hypothetical protein
MPTLGVVLNLLYKLQSGTHYLIAGQYTAGSIDAIIDDLTPGEYYTIAVQAFSAFGIGSTVRVVTGTNALAPSNATPPNAPTSVTYVAGNSSDFGRAPETFAGVLAYSFRLNWTAPSQKSVVGYEALWTTVDSDAAADAGYAAGLAFSQSIEEEVFSSASIFSGYARVRSVDRTGQKSAWAGGGVNINTYWGRAAGTMTSQNATNVLTTGITQGAGSLQRKVVARQPVYKQINLSGGAASETYSLDITNWGFSAAPDVGWFQSADQGGMLIRYDYDSSSSTSAELRITMADGSNVPAWTNMEITGELAEYS